MNMLMICDGIHDVVNVCIVNRLFYGLECEDMSILELLLMLRR